MKLQDQVITLEQAKRLGELGVIQARSLFFYDTEEKIAYNPWLSSGGYQYPEYCFSAFTVAELLLMNNQTITLNNLQCLKPGEALADHLISRIERAEITPEECNQRLIN